MFSLSIWVLIYSGRDWFLEDLNFVERNSKNVSNLEKISEKKLIKEVETNFKLVGILLAIAGLLAAWPGRDPAPGTEDLSF